MSLEKTQQLFKGLCLNATEEDLDSYLSKLLNKEEKNFLLSQGEKRLRVYGRLISGGVHAVLETAMPLLFSILDDKESKLIVKDFLKIKPPQSPYYRKIPNHFLSFLFLHDHLLEEKYPFLKDLVDYEVSDYDLIFQKNPSHFPSMDPKARLQDLKVFFNPNLYYKSYTYAVHRAEKESSSIPKEETKLILYRDPKSLKVKEKILNTPQSQMMTCFYRQDKNLGQIIKEGQLKEGETLNFLQDLMREKIVLGFLSV